ncbi:MAG: hypothetical protein UX22_C0007G0022 [Candidatus Jorgensenbacteria bacterium GW2011_GWA2_45_9]|nr:MAG: hypothetical protein UX22_C0007G0022 [Candidatus Jorgensenbacteria bacterium GW2011_GWA2_45_9]
MLNNFHKPAYDESSGKQADTGSEFGGWEKDNELSNKGRRDKTAWKKIIQRGVWIIIGIAVIAAGAFFISRLARRSSGVMVEIQGPDSVSRGVPFEITIQVANDIDSFIKNGVITVNTTDGVLYADNASGANLIKEQIGDLGGGSLSRKTLRFLSVGPANSVQKITAKLSFSSLGAEYELERSKEVIIGESAVGVEVKKPEQIVSGSKFNLQIDYENKSNFDFSGVAIEVKYPSEFTFSSASYNPSSLNNHWQLGALKARTRGSIQITGSLDASEKNSFDFPVSVFVEFSGRDYLIAEATGNAFIAPSPLSLSITANGSDNFTARQGEEIKYRITYENKSGISLADAVIEAKIEGDMFDVKTVGGNGGFDSRLNTVTWTASKVPELSLLDPGASGSVEFSVRLLPAIPVKRASDKNFTLKVSVRMDSPSVPYYLDADKTTGFAALETKIAGSASFTAKAFYRDASAQIVNSGVLPPKVNTPTRYTVHWIIENYGSGLKDIAVRGFLESGVKWTGVVKSNTGSVPVYNPRTEEVVWTVDNIEANRGLFGDPVEAVFQIEAVPNITQVGRYEPLVKEAKFSATDAFTGASISDSSKELTTSLSDDKTVGRNEGIVVQ